MLSSANRISDDDDGIFEDNCNISDDSEEIKCHCSSRIRRVGGVGGSRSAFVVYIYMWITIFSICCQGLPPVIKIGT